MSDARQDAPHVRSNQDIRVEVSHTHVCEQDEINKVFIEKRPFVGFASDLIFLVTFSIQEKK